MQSTETEPHEGATRFRRELFRTLETGWNWTRVSLKPFGSLTRSCSPPVACRHQSAGIDADRQGSSVAGPQADGPTFAQDWIDDARVISKSDTATARDLADAT